MKIKEIPWTIPTTLFGIIILAFFVMGLFGLKFQLGLHTYRIYKTDSVSQDSRLFASSICYSRSSSTGDTSLIVIPLPNSSTDLNAECVKRIDNQWHAIGIVKQGHFTADCSGDIVTELYGGGTYTSFVSIQTFKEASEKFNSCASNSAFICCSK